jgi:hypothetical protein
MKNALSGHHKSEELATDLLIGRQEAGQVSSTTDALVADVLLEGTASATGRLPGNQQAQREATDRTLLKKAPTDNAPAKASRIPEGSGSEDFSGRR